MEWMGLLMLLGVVGLWLLALAPGRRLAPAAAGELHPGYGLALLMAAVALRLAASIMLLRHGFVFHTFDEPNRLHLSNLWAASPYLFTWDGVWLTGGIAWFGLWIRLLGNSALGALAGIQAAQFLALAAVWWLALTVSRRHWVAAAAALLAAPGYTGLWFGSGVLADNLAVAGFCLALAGCWRFLERDSPGRRHWPDALAAGSFLFAAASVHYVAWMAIMAGAPFFLGALVRRWRRASRSWRLAAGFILLAAAAFPLLWLIESHRQLGHPLQFLRNEHQMLHDWMSEEMRQAGAWGRFWVYPAELVGQLRWLLAGAAGLGLALLARGPRRGPLLVLAGIILSLVLLMSLSAASSGVGRPMRAVVIPYTLLLVLFALSLRALEPAWRRGGTGRLATAACLALLGIGWLGFNGLTANRFDETEGPRLNHDLVALGHWLQQETRMPEWMHPFGPATRIGVYAPADRHMDALHLVGFIGGVLEQMEHLATPAQLEQRRPEFLLTLEAPPAGYGPLRQFGPWQLLRRD